MLDRDINDRDVDSKLEINQIVDIIKKKRGRKPKNFLNSTINKVQEVSEVANESIETNVIKKRGRKSNTKIINITPEINMDILTTLIAHLPLKMSDVYKVTNLSINNEDHNKNMNGNISLETITSGMHVENERETKETKGNDIAKETKETKETKELRSELVSSYVELNDENEVFENTSSKYDEVSFANCMSCSTLESKIEKLEMEIKKLKNGIINNTTTFNKKLYESKVQFINKNTNEWTEKTEICCWWCCHQFDNVPLGIPEFINKDTYYLFGCFCSFNCMLAYNSDINDYKIWDRQSNIYQMKNKIDIDNKIMIQNAPPRQTLKLFGGPLSIMDYRQNFFMVNKEFRHFFPPMVSIIGMIEEENRDLSGNKKVQYNKSYEHTLVKRKKPLPNKSSTLNIMINKM
jgi:hypothetical protein